MAGDNEWMGYRDGGFSNLAIVFAEPNDKCQFNSEAISVKCHREKPHQKPRK